MDPKNKKRAPTSGADTNKPLYRDPFGMPGTAPPDAPDIQRENPNELPRPKPDSGATPFRK